MAVNNDDLYDEMQRRQQSQQPGDPNTPPVNAAGGAWQSNTANSPSDPNGLISTPTTGQPGAQPGIAPKTQSGETMSWLTGNNKVNLPGWDNSRTDMAPKYEYGRFAQDWMGQGKAWGADAVRAFVASDPRWEIDPHSSQDDPHIRVRQDQMGTFGDEFANRQSIYQDTVIDSGPGGRNGLSFSNVQGDPALGYEAPTPDSGPAQMASSVTPPVNPGMPTGGTQGPTPPAQAVDTGGNGSELALPTFASAAAAATGAAAPATPAPAVDPRTGGGLRQMPGWVQGADGTWFPPSNGAGASGAGAGGATVGAGTRDPRWAAYYDQLLKRSGQSLDVDANDPIIKAQVDASTAVATRESLKQQQAAAERGGSYATGATENAARMSSENVQSQAAMQQAGLMGKEVSDRRAEIAQALQLQQGVLTTDEQSRLRQEDQALEARQQDLASAQASAQNALAGRSLTLSESDAQQRWRQMEWERAFRDRGWESDLAQTNWGNEHQMWG